MSEENRNIATLYEQNTGRIIQNIRVPIGVSVEDVVGLEPNQAVLIGQQAPDVDAFKVEGGQFVAIDPPVRNIDQTKRAAKEVVDRIASVLRAEKITVGMGQAETYVAKEAEARAYLVDEAPIIENYPMVLAEVGVTGETSHDVAAAIVAKADEWRQIAGRIEAVRLAAKQSINAASSEDEITTIQDGIVWPT